MNELEKINETIFESMELQKVLDYIQWRKFVGVINKAINACKTSNYKVSDHFAGAGKMV